MNDGAIEPYRVPAPMRADLIAWPADFGTRFLVTVDVEEEFDWSRPLDRANRATTAIRALPGAHRRLSGWGIAPLYMVDHPVATDPLAIEILRGLAAEHAEIGAQLHSWVTPPYADATPGDSYAGNLSRDLEAAKLDALGDALFAAVSRRPRAYRAGRYGIGPNTLALLAARGYRLDSSVRARYDYRADGGPDFRDVGNAAYRRDGLIELPLTTVFTGVMRRGGQPLHDRLGTVPKARGAFARARLLQRVALTPEDMPIAEALEAVRIAVGEGERLLQFWFHSPTLVPGNTPYVRSGTDLASFWRWWDRMIAHLDMLGVRPASLDQILAAADG